MIHCTIGKASFEVKALHENLHALLADLQKAKPASAKGIYFKRVSVSSTMGPGVRWTSRASARKRRARRTIEDDLMQGRSWPRASRHRGGAKPGRSSSKTAGGERSP